MRAAQMVKVNKKGRHVTLLVNGSASYSVTIEQLAKRGAALVALCEALRMAGIATDLYVGIGLRPMDGYAEVFLLVN
jgi:hypothetical protein